MMRVSRPLIFMLLCAFPASADATQAKIDADTCTQLRLEQIKFRQSGILDDMQKGADWAKANLSADRLKEIEKYLALDEQVKFGCRDAKLSPEAEKASEAAERIEMNSDADPTAPPVVQSPDGDAKPQSKGKKPAAKKAVQKKPKPRPDDTQNAPDPKAPVAAEGAAAAGAIVAPQAAPAVGATTSAVAPETPALGFGETVVLPPPGQ